MMANLNLNIEKNPYNNHQSFYENNQSQFLNNPYNNPDMNFMQKAPAENTYYNQTGSSEFMPNMGFENPSSFQDFSQQNFMGGNYMMNQPPSYQNLSSYYGGSTNPTMFNSMNNMGYPNSQFGMGNGYYTPYGGQVMNQNQFDQYQMMVGQMGYSNMPYRMNQNYDMMGGMPNNSNYYNMMINQGQMQSSKRNPRLSREKSLESTSLSDILPNIVDFCKDHSGSRLVQKKFEECNESERDQIFDKLKDHIYPLTKDVFGNYVIQKLLDHCNKEKMQVVIKHLKGNIYDLTMHMYGCRVVQKALDLAEEQDVQDYLEELNGFVFKCVEDQNGNHVIQKLIEKLPKGGHEPIIKAISGRVCELSVHQYGCRVIQRIFEYCSQDEKDKVLVELEERVVELCLDQYGNYVIQHIIEKQPPEKFHKIFQDVQGKIFDMSIHKFAR